MGNDGIRASAAASSDDGLQPAEVMAALERMLVSPSFARSPRLRAFLRYIVEARIAGREDSPKEYELGTRVFERQLRFDPQADPIVRVQARQLRFKLREYYGSEGAGETIRIDLPKGTYLPTIEQQPLAADEPETEARRQEVALATAPVTVAAIQTADAIEPASVPASFEETNGNHRRARWMIWLVLALALPLLLLALRRKIAPSAVGTYKPKAEARALYLEGRYHWNQRKPESLRKALDDFEGAAAEDPNYAEAYVGMADTYNLLREYANMPAQEAFALGTRAAQRAIELNPSSAEAHSSLAFDLFWGGWDAQGSEREFRKAIELDPDYERAHHWFATSLMAEGRMRESRAEIERARDLDPTSPSIRADYALVLFSMGEKSKAIPMLHDLEVTDPRFLSPHRYLAIIAECTSDAPSYILESRSVAELSQAPMAAAIADAARNGYAASGERGMLEAVLAVQQRAYEMQHETPYTLAETSALLGRTDEALHYLQAAYGMHDSNMMALPSQCSLDKVRQDPGFQQLLAKVHELQEGRSVSSLR